MQLVVFSVQSQILDLSDDRQLFVDHYLVDQLEGAMLRKHVPRNEGVVLYFDKPWEGNFSAYCTILKDGVKYKAYYRGIRDAGQDGGSNETTCYAESDDGISWRKPELGIYEINGTRDNNVILAHAAPIAHNFSPFIDKNPRAPASQRFKALGGNKNSGLIAMTSPDGIHWVKLQEGPVFTEGIFDSQNVSFWSESEQMYICYFRTWTQQGYSGFRSVGRTTSLDFIHWTPPVQMTFGDTPLEHIYTQQTSPYYRAPQIYLAIGARFMPNRQVVSEEKAMELNVNQKYYNDCSDVVLLSTRGGNVYDRTFMESFIRPGIGLSNWVSRSNYPALNLVETSENEISLYVNENYAQPTAHVKRYSMRVDGLASLYAGYSGGEMTTKPFTFQGNELEINYATSAAGFIRIEIQDGDGKLLKGYSLEEAEEIIGNEIQRIVQWNGSSDVSSLTGEIIRMRIVLKDADLYSFKFKKNTPSD